MKNSSAMAIALLISCLSTNRQLGGLIMLPYGVGERQISGPDWLTNRYDIIAKVPENTTKEEIPLMLQTLLP